MTRDGLKVGRLLAGLGLMLALVGPSTAQQSTHEVLAEIDGKPITAEEVEKALGTPLQKLQEQMYSMKRQKLHAIIVEHLLAAEAAKRGMSVQQLLDVDVAPSLGVVPEQEVERFYEANKARFEGRDEAEAREQVRSMLQAQRRTNALEAYVQKLESQSYVVVHLTSPPVVRIEVPIDGARARGPVGAPITIVEFTDFHCPFCKRVLPTLTQIESQYGEKVKVVFRDFPLNRLHPQASKAHEAARCADAQGQFWAYHDQLYAHTPQASPEQLTAYAREVGLDIAAFEQCISSGRHQDAVEQDIAEGTQLGVTGTPTFFVNGRLLVGAQPIEKFVELIEEELVVAQIRK